MFIVYFYCNSLVVALVNIVCLCSINSIFIQKYCLNPSNGLDKKLYQLRIKTSG